MPLDCIAGIDVRLADQGKNCRPTGCACDLISNRQSIPPNGWSATTTDVPRIRSLTVHFQDDRRQNLQPQHWHRAGQLFVHIIADVVAVALEDDAQTVPREQPVISTSGPFARYRVYSLHQGR